uniref:Lysozyme n=1 Tax=Rhodopseudomonas palustris (strain DX-1) TaxID=652103 RepID=E6VL46_RHOPX
MAIKTSHKLTGAALATIMIAVPVVSDFEGLWLVAKPDTLAHGIPTVCFGETEGVKIGDRYTKEQCEQMLANKLPRYLYEIDRCIKAPVSNRTRAAYLSFAYNVGSGGFCRSTALKRLNAGRDAEACEAMRPWNKAGGKFRQGLANRREKEIKMCLAGLKDPKTTLGASSVAPTFELAATVNPEIEATPKPSLPARKTSWEKVKGWFWSK